MLPDGTITIFDNRTDGEASRVVQYEIDETARTATLVWSYEEVDGNLGAFMGSARRQDDGHTVINWGSSQPMVEEIDINGDRQLVITRSGRDPVSGGEVSAHHRGHRRPARQRGR